MVWLGWVKCVAFRVCCLESNVRFQLEMMAIDLLSIVVMRNKNGQLVGQLFAFV